jgi:hypothetical protein
MILMRFPGRAESTGPLGVGGPVYIIITIFYMIEADTCLRSLKAGITASRRRNTKYRGIAPKDE